MNIRECKGGGAYPYQVILKELKRPKERLELDMAFHVVVRKWRKSVSKLHSISLFETFEEADRKYRELSSVLVGNKGKR